ncbi:MAG: CheR family methyltransferase [Lentimicrobium sp.]|jgi:two-component system CheB/CheR fusion protein|nr:CheR family methyltransferase [Lentimicrobium sp.]
MSNSGYYTFLENNTDELHTLFKDFLIGVTNFFRDPEAFENLYKKVIPDLFIERDIDVPIRIWVPGCSTGEEAYSIAMLIKEYMDSHKLNDYKVQIFATDIDKVAVEKARQAVYPDSISLDVSETRLNKFFHKEKNSYQVVKSIRDMIVFAEQSVVKDPPFSKVDLITCRNLLIYMSNELQEKVTSTFHYSLNQNGYLFLGSSETLGQNREMFTIKDKKWKFYQKKNIISKGVFISDLPSYYPGFINSAEIIRQPLRTEKVTLKSLVESKVLEGFSPVAVLVNGQFDIVYLHGKTSDYLEPVQGVANMNILQMARQDIRIKLNVALNKAFREKIPIVEEKLHLKIGKKLKYINLHISPVETQNDTPDLFMVVFQDITEKENILNSEIQEFGEKDLHYINNLEQELKRTKDYLQSVIEEAETTNEELKATNEELQSSNEELQSTNEELETSKEEMQSINEELMTVNTEHQNKIQELSDINNDVSNYLSSTGIATIFLDLELKLKKFTPMVADFFNFISTDIDRPISNFTSKLNYSHFLRDIKSVLATLNTVVKEIGGDDKSYICRIMPYRTLENVVKGVVITYVDITERKKFETALSQSAERYQQIFDDAPNSIIIHDLKMHIIDVNKKAEAEFGYSKEEFLKKTVFDLHSKDNMAQVKKIGSVLKEKVIHETETTFTKKDGSFFFANATHTKYSIEGNHFTRIVIENITKEKLAVNAFKESEDKFIKTINNVSIGMAIISVTGKWLNVNQSFCKQLGYTVEELLQMTVQEVTYPDDLETDQKYRQELFENKRENYQTKKRYFHKNGNIVWVLITNSLVKNTEGEPHYFISQIIDINE